MKKFAVIAAIAAIVPFLLVSCGGGQEDEIKAYLDDVLEASTAYATDIEKAESGKDFAEAINKYMDAMVVLSEKGKKLQKKYPDAEKDAPYLDEYEKKMSAIAVRIQKNTAPKMMKFLSDPHFAKAMENMHKKMSKIDLPYQK